MSTTSSVGFPDRVCVIDAKYQQRPLQKNQNRFESGGTAASCRPDRNSADIALEAAGVAPSVRSFAGIWRSRRDAQYLDLSHPQVLDHVRDIVEKICGWGYELIKYDFSTYDLLTAWDDLPLAVEPCTRSLYDRTVNAQALKNLYRIIYEAAGDSLIIGCSCIGHLGVGRGADARNASGAEGGLCSGLPSEQSGRAAGLDEQCLPGALED